MYKIYKKTVLVLSDQDEEIKIYVSDIAPIINELIPSQKNEEEFLNYIRQIAECLSGEMPDPNPNCKFCISPFYVAL